MEKKDVLLRVENIVKHFDISGGLLDQLFFERWKLRRRRVLVKAVNSVSFSIHKGETFSIVGESGCGKSTLARVAMGLFRPNSGKMFFRGDRIDDKSPREMIPYRSKMQMIFQDPYASLNPRKTVRQTLEEPVRFHNRSITDPHVKEKIAFVMEQVGVDPKWSRRYPHEFSGGQRQRISIARALMVDPEFIVADEPVSALDVSIQAQILNLMMDAQKSRGLTYMFITHDLSVVRHISSRVAVMYLGTLCELSTPSLLFEDPLHPYTRALLSAIPRLGESRENRIRLRGEVPTPIDLPSGCVFHGRCLYSEERCKKEVPILKMRTDGRLVACHGVEEGRI